MKAKVIHRRDGAVDYFIDGKRVTQAEYDAAFPSKLEYGEGAASPHVATFQPLASVGLSVHPTQVKEVNEQARRHGTGVQYDPSGRAHVPTRDARRRELKVRGFIDNDGSYGD